MGRGRWEVGGSVCGREEGEVGRCWYRRRGGTGSVNRESEDLPGGGERSSAMVAEEKQEGGNNEGAVMDFAGVDGRRC